MYDNLAVSNRVYLIYCDIGNYRHWIKKSTNPEKFFSNFDKLINALKELTVIDYEYLNPTPDDELNDALNKEQEYYQAFLARYWEKTACEIVKLKTEKSKKNKADKFYSSIKPFENRFSKETLQMILNSDFSSVDINYAHNHMYKTDHDNYFLFETNEKIDHLTPEKLLCSARCNKQDYLFYVNNKALLDRLIGYPVENEIFKDLCKLYFVYEDRRKIERYLRIKYNIESWFAKLLSLSLDRIICAHRDYRKLQDCYRESQYIILTHDAPCEKCQAHRNKVYYVKDAEIGVNFPPFCSHGCSTAASYIDGITKISSIPLSRADKLFAKAVNLQEDGKYEEAAEQGLMACLLVPESERYIQYVPKMLAKVKRYNEAVQILDNYISQADKVNDLYKRQRDRYQNRIHKDSAERTSPK